MKAVSGVAKGVTPERRLEDDTYQFHQQNPAVQACRMPKRIRTVTGCSTCRKRRIKCDETRVSIVLSPHAVGYHESNMADHRSSPDPYSQGVRTAQNTLTDNVNILSNRMKELGIYRCSRLSHMQRAVVWLLLERRYFPRPRF